MAITERQRLSRATGLGSSDSAAVLGVSPWENAASIRLKKLGLLEDEPASELAEIGTHLEDGVATLAGKRLGVQLVKPTGTYKLAGTPLLANLDRQIEKAARGQSLVELKDSGLDDKWGEPGTDEVPPYVLVQVVHQMLCADAPEGHIARLGRGFKRGLFMYHITRTDDVKRLMDVMSQLLPKWWTKHIENEEPLPEGSPPPDLDILKRVIREPKTTVILPDDLVLAWRQTDEHRKAAEKADEEAKARVLAALGTAEGGTCNHGVLSYLEQTRKEYVVQAATFRVARFKAAK